MKYIYIEDIHEGSVSLGILCRPGGQAVRHVVTELLARWRTDAELLVDGRLDPLHARLLVDDALPFL